MISLFKNVHIFWFIWTLVLLIFFMYIQYLANKRNIYHSRPTEFTPPKNISPILAGFLIDGEFHIRDYLAGYTYLVEQGIIKINKEKPEKRDFDLKILNRAQIYIEKIAYENGYIEKGFSFYQSSLLYGIMTFLLIGGFVFYIKQISGTHDFKFLYGSYIFYGSLPVFIYLMYKILYLAKYKLTKKGLDAKNSLLGFKKFLSVAETERMDYFNNIKNNKNSFTQYLPYAIALSVENQWKNKYSSLVADIPITYSLQYIRLPRIPNECAGIIGFIDLVQKTKEKE